MLRYIAMLNMLLLYLKKEIICGYVAMERIYVTVSIKTLHVSIIYMGSHK